MHTIEELGTNVPAFLAKLWKIVEDPEINDLISWGPGGTSFFIRNQARFSRELLPLYYKHNNMASFVRQLNMYGFHKVVSIEGGGLKVDKDEMEFAHQYFLMGHPYLLEHIKRKIPTTKTTEESRTGSKPELVTKVLSEVKGMKGRQDSVDSQLHALKRENEVLWREVAILRQKHIKQQQIVNKLIQFLVSMVQSSRGSGLGIKRHYPLMLNDITHRPSKTAKLNGRLADRNSVPSNMSPTGPVIHELDPSDLLDDCVNPVEDNAANTDFLTADLCGGVDGEVHSPSSCERLSHPSPEALLELAEEYPLSPDILSPAAVSVKSKVGGRRGGQGRHNRKKRVKATATSTTTAPVTTEAANKEPEESINVGNFLEIVLPNLVSEETVQSNDDNLNVLDNNFEDSVVPDQNSLMTDTKDNLADSEMVEGLIVPDENSMTDATKAVIYALSSDNIASKSAVSNPIDDTSLNNQLTFDLMSNNSSTSVSASTPVYTKQDNNKSSSKDSSKMIPNNSTSSKYSLVTSDPTTNCSSKDTLVANSPSDMTLACASNSVDNNGLNRENLDCHLDNMQSELETLKELLKGDGYSLDANTLLGVCPSLLGLETDVLLKLFGDDPLSYGISMMDEGESEQNKENGGAGSELMTYSSNLLDLGDVFDSQASDNWSLPDNFDSTNFENESSELNTPQVVLLNGPSFSGTSVSPSSPTKRKKK